MSRKTNRRASEKLETLYARIPRVACRGLCSIACGPVPMTTLEADRLRRADQARRLPMILEDASCVYLTKSRCSVYHARPLICRAWGVIKSLSCMHGCVPERWLSEVEYVQIAKAVERLGGQMVVPTFGEMIPTQTYLDLQTDRVPQEYVDLMAEKVRALRALHGGRIVGAYPSEKAEMINIDKD